MFLGETSTNTKMVRRYGRAPRGESCRVAVPFEQWKTITATTGLRISGPTAALLFDGPMTGARLRGYVDETMIPTLKPSDPFVTDNFPAHKVSGVHERVEAAGARLLYLPAYFPEFNSITLVFFELQAILCAMANRTLGDLWNAIQRALRHSTSAKCRRYIAAAGYNAYDSTCSDAARAISST